MLNACLTAAKRPRYVFIFFQAQKEAIMASMDATLTEWNIAITREVALRNKFAKDYDRLRHLFHNAEMKGLGVQGESTFNSTFKPMEVKLGGRPLAAAASGSSQIMVPPPPPAPAAVPSTSTGTGGAQQVQDVSEMVFIKDGTGKYPCPICGRHEKYLETLRAHMRKHLGQYLLCQQCGKKYRHLKSFKKHIAFHLRGKEYVCHICLHKSENEANAKSHMSKHAKTQQYACPLENCNQLLAHASEFNRHLRGVHKLDPHKANLKVKVMPVEFVTRREFLIQTGQMDPYATTTEGQEEEVEDDDDDEEEEEEQENE